MLVQIGGTFENFSETYLHGPFEERPKVFDGVGMNCAVNVKLCMLDEGMIAALGAQLMVSAMFIGVHGGARLNMILDDGVGELSPPVLRTTRGELGLAALAVQ